MLHETAPEFLETQENRFLQKISLQKYLCTSCLQCNFEDCSNQNAVNNGEDDADLEEFYKETDHPEQIFDFAIVPSFVPFFFGSTIEPLQFVQIKGEDVAKKYIADP